MPMNQVLQLYRLPLLPLSADEAARCLSAISGAADFKLVQVMVTERVAHCAVMAAGWILNPYVDCGKWEIVEEVVSPEGARYEVAGDGEGIDALLMWTPPKLRRADQACCEGYRPGLCWAEDRR